MSKHTPGPWHVSASSQYVRKNDTPDWPAWNVCELNTEHEAAEANARLIAAAPDLLAACQRFIEGYEGRDDEGYRMRIEGIQAMRAAIAKATGEQP